MALLAFHSAALPVEATFCSPGSLGLKRLFLRTERRRAGVLRSLDKIKGTVARCCMLGPLRIQVGARLFEVRKEGLVIAQCYSHAALCRSVLRSDAFPVALTTRRPRSGEVVEHGWRYFNKMRHSLRYAIPALFEFQLLSAAHAKNMRIWGGVPPCAQQLWIASQQPNVGSHMASGSGG